MAEEDDAASFAAHMAKMTVLESTEAGSDVESEDGETNEAVEEGESTAAAARKKKKKKKKTAAQKRAAAAANAQGKEEPTPVVLKISRNKHMKYISSYHGPWLQLPHEVLDQLLNVNCAPDNGIPLRSLIENRSTTAALRQKYRTPPTTAAGDGEARTNDSSPYEGDGAAQGDGRNLPPPIDPAVFRGVAAIRRLVDDASDLAVRAASGMSAAALGALNPNSAMTGGGGNALGLEQNAGGRNPAMSPIRQHRLRKLAVAKLAEAYRIDEIAASVAVMQGATGLDDLAVRVLKNDPDCADAQYVHFFHEKIPSRTLAVSTDTSILDQLIVRDPTRLEFYRTRGTVHGFKQDYASAIRNFTQALTQAKASRKAREHHVHHHDGAAKGRKKGRGKSAQKALPNEERNADANGTAIRDEAMAASIGKEPGDDIERQLLFHRGMSYFHSACQMIEQAVLGIENVDYPQGGLSNEGGELTLRNIGIALKDETGGLFGCADKEKKERYRSVLSDPAFKERVGVFLRRSIRDMERFLAFFGVWEAPAGTTVEEDKRFVNPRSTERPLTFRGRRLIHHRSLSGRNRYSDPRTKDLAHGGKTEGEAPLLTTYHPLIIEAHFAILLGHLLLGDFAALVPLHYRAVRIMDHLEGYPAFLPARSLNQSEYAELLERLASTWLAKREANGVYAPEGTEHDVVHEGDLTALHHLLSFFTEDFADALVAAAEAANREAQAHEDASKAKKGGKAVLSITDSATANSTKGSWAEQRERAEAERRKIDPSYAVYNTARAEVALAWLTAVVLPEKEEEEQKGPQSSSKGKGKGKASAEGHQHGLNGSFSPAADEDEDV